MRYFGLQSRFLCVAANGPKNWTHNTILQETAVVIIIFLKQEKIVIHFKRFAKNSIIKKLDGEILTSSSKRKTKKIFLL